MVKFEKLPEVRQQIDGVCEERKAIEKRLKSANDFCNDAERDQEPIYVMDDLGKVNKNVRKGDDIQKKLDRAQDELGKLDQDLGALDKKADEAVKNNPKLKAQAD